MISPPRPHRLAVQPDDIPSELTTEARWVVWRDDLRADQWAKVPYQIDGRMARSNDPTTWTTFAVALTVYQAGEFSGMGLMLHEGEFAVVDLDHCRDAQTGALDATAQEIIAKVGSYTEISPSGTGVHIFIKSSTKLAKGITRRRGGIELYGAGDVRYMSVTGQRLNDLPIREYDLGVLHADLFGVETPEPPEPRMVATVQPMNATDNAVLDKAFEAANGARIRALYAGENAGYESTSEARMALLRHLAFYSADAGQIERIFMSSGMRTAKGERLAFAEIEKIFSDQTERYDWNRTKITHGKAVAEPEVKNGQVSTSVDVDEWQEADPPIVLPDFPLDCFPPHVAAFVKAAADAAGSPVDMVALPALVTMAAAIGGSRAIELKSSWSEIPVIWGAIVAPPSSGKTPAMRPVLEPLRRWQSDRFREFNNELGNYTRDLEDWTARKGKDRGDKPEKPTAARIIVDDFTIEQLCAINQENPRGVVAVKDELSAWVRSMNQYKGGKGSDRSHALSLWSSVPITVDRKINPIPLHIDRPVVSVIGGIQPGLLSELHDQEGADGFLERFLFTMQPEASAGGWTDDDIAPKLMNDWTATVLQLLALNMTEGDRGPAPMKLTMASAAREAWVDGYNAHMASLKDANESTRGLYGKYQAYAARFALILQLAGDPSPSNVLISEAAVRSAWQLVDYFKMHARVAFGASLASAIDRKVDALVAYMRKSGGSATRREILRRHIGSAQSASEVDAIISRMVDRRIGYRQIEKVNGGQRVTAVLGAPGIIES